MIFLSASSMFAVLIYCFIGMYAYLQNPKSTIHKIFLGLCLSYAIWSFGYSFVYLLDDKNAISMWNKIAAIGWCSFSALSLYLVLLITENRIIKSTFRFMIFIPGMVFFYMTVFLFGPTLDTPLLVSNIFYIGDFIYNFSYLLASIVILLLWGMRSNSLRTKKQVRILVITSMVPFILNLLTQTILPALHILTLPNIGQLYSVIMILGIYIVISRYKFLKMPEDFIFEEVMREMLDMTILVNAAEEIIKVNKNTLLMLDYSNEELLGRPAKSIIPNIDLTCLASKVKRTESIRFSNIALRAKSGTDIPANVSCTPILDRNINDLLGSILVIQDLRLINELKQKNNELLERVIRDSLTRLYNHQYSLELLEKELNEAISRGKYLSLMMLDIDDFKQVNDTCGHQFGDSVLVTIANLLVDIIQNAGHVGRYGGEEFIIILPETPIGRALMIGEEIRCKIKNHTFAKHCAITVSMGIRELHNEDAPKLIRKADQLLYMAKENGKDRVECYLAH